MSFRDNLQHLRATRNMTQEQLAMLMGVSRQSVTKWEAEKAYPEMDKLLKLRDIFGCTLDELVQGDLTNRPKEPGLGIAEGPAQDMCGYDEHMRQHARNMAVGIPLIILGMAGAAFFGELGPNMLPIDNDALSGLVFLAFTLVGLCFIIPAGLRHDAFAKAHPYVEDFYPATQREAANRLFSCGIVGGIVAIFVGVMLSIGLDDRVFWTGSAFLACVAVGVALLIYASLMHGRINVDEYNNNALENLSDDEIRELGAGDADALVIQKHRSARLGATCGIIMLVVTAIALSLLFLSPYLGTASAAASSFFWLPWLIGGLACGIVSLIYNMRS